MSGETVVIDGEDYTATDAEARAIIGYLARYRGVTEQDVARIPYRVLVNMILKAHYEIEAARSDINATQARP